MLRIALLLLLAATPAAAIEPELPDYTRPGFYLGAGGYFQGENYHVEEPFSGDLDSSAGFSVRAGYRIDRIFATELQYEWLHQFIEDLLDLGDASLLGVNTRVYWPLERFQPNFILGANWMHAPALGKSSKQDAFALRFGLGLDIYLTERIVLSLDATYVQPTATLADYPFVSAGGGFSFRF